MFSERASYLFILKYIYITQPLRYCEPELLFPADNAKPSKKLISKQVKNMLKIIEYF